MPRIGRNATALALLSTALLGGCGERILLQDDGGHFVVVAQLDPAASTLIATANARRPDLTVAPSANMVDTIARHAPQLTLVAVVDRPERAGATLAATVVPAETADAAVDLARLTALDVDAPPRLGLGARWLTSANAAAGGTAVPSPGDFALRTLCMQEQQVLQGPADAPPLAVAIIARPGDERLQALRSAIAAERGDRRPVRPVEFAVDGADDAAWHRALRQCEQSDCRTAIVVLDGGDAALSATARAEAVSADLQLVVVGDEPADEQFSHWIGADRETLGRALGAAIRALRPDGARLLELDDDSPGCTEVLQGLHAALRLVAR